MLLINLRDVEISEYMPLHDEKHIRQLTESSEIPDAKTRRLRSRIQPTNDYKDDPSRRAERAAVRQAGASIPIAEGRVPEVGQSERDLPFMAARRLL
jgi:hypothetical protein